jgi:hypothetical protein
MVSSSLKILGRTVRPAGRSVRTHVDDERHRAESTALTRLTVLAAVYRERVGRRRRDNLITRKTRPPDHDDPEAVSFYALELVS